MKTKKRKGQMSLVPVIISIMVAVVIGVAVTIPIITTQVTTATTLGTYSGTLSSLNATTLTLPNGDLVDGTFVATVRNMSTGCDGVGGTIPGQTVTAANYTLTLGDQATEGTVYWNMAPASMINATLANITYSYYPATYIKSTTVITLLQLIPLFIALLLVVAAVALVKIS